MALNGDKDFAALSKLKDDGSNYSDWAFRLDMVLTVKGLQDHIKHGPTGAPPVDATGAAVTEAQRQKDMSARAIFVLSLSDSLFSIVRACTTAKETWNVLADRFNSRT